MIPYFVLVERAIAELCMDVFVLRIPWASDQRTGEKLNVTFQVRALRRSCQASDARLEDSTLGISSTR